MTRERAALTEVQKMRIRKLYSEGVSQDALTARFGVTQARISQIIKEESAL